MARDVEIDIVARDKTGAAVTGAMSSFKRLQAKVKSATDAMSGGILSTFKALPPQVQAVAAAAAAAIGVTMAAAVGAAITAGILLAVGGGVLALGIKAAADSPQVQAAWTRFRDRGKKVFDGFGKPFEGPVSRALDTFGDAIERMGPTLKRMGASMAPIIDKLAPALASMAEKSLPGIEKAMEAGKPLWDTLAEHAPDIGAAISRFFDSIAKGGPGANKFLGDFLNVLEGAIVVLGIVIGTLATLYGKAREVWIGVAKVFTSGVKVILSVIGTIVAGAAAAFGWIPGLGPKLKTAAEDFEKFRTRANAALDAITDERVNVTIVTRRVEGGGISQHADQGGGGRQGGQEHRATGGPVGRGLSYLVGERGPEILTMGSQSGYITPNHALGGGDTTVTVIIDGKALDSSVYRVMSERDRGLKRRVQAGAR